MARAGVAASARRDPESLPCLLAGDWHHSYNLRVKRDLQGGQWQARGEAMLRARGWLADIPEPLQGKLIALGRWVQRQPGEPLAMAG